MEDGPSAELEHLAWVRLQCLQIAATSKPKASAATHVALAMEYEIYALSGAGEGEETVH